MEANQSILVNESMEGNQSIEEEFFSFEEKEEASQDVCLRSSTKQSNEYKDSQEEYTNSQEEYTNSQEEYTNSQEEYTNSQEEFINSQDDFNDLQKQQSFKDSTGYKDSKMEKYEDSHGSEDMDFQGKKSNDIGETKKTYKVYQGSEGEYKGVQVDVEKPEDKEDDRTKMEGKNHDREDQEMNESRGGTENPQVIPMKGNKKHQDSERDKDVYQKKTGNKSEVSSITSVSFASDSNLNKSAARKLPLENSFRRKDKTRYENDESRKEGSVLRKAESVPRKAERVPRKAESVPGKEGRVSRNEKEEEERRKSTEQRMDESWTLVMTSTPVTVKIPKETATIEVGFINLRYYEIQITQIIIK